MTFDKYESGKNSNMTSEISSMMLLSDFLTLLYFICYTKSIV